MKALYRKYRPLSLSSVVGQDQTIAQLSGALASNKISHAYLFVGPRGCGKTSVARIFAHEINHFEYQLEDSYVDIIEIDAATFTGVDNIRELREKAMIVPSVGKYKIYIIDEIHMLSTNAFNALLKILEEPPEHVVFIMATTNPEKVPATILSRTQIYRFSLADIDTMQTFLNSVAERENIKISTEALKIIAERGGGSFRDSLSILDQISTLSSSEQIINEDTVISAIGIPNHQEIISLLNAYENNEYSTITTLLSQILNTGTTAESIALELIQQILKAPTKKKLFLIEKLFNVNGSFPEAKLTVALISPNQSTSPTLNPTVSNTLPDSSSSINSLSNTDSYTNVNFSSSINPSKNVNSSINADAPSDTFSKLRDTLVKNAKNHKAERVSDTSNPIDTESDSPPPTLPEAVISTSGDFNFNGFIANITNINPSLITALKKSCFLFSQNRLDIYPEKVVYWRILNQKNNLEVLRSASSSIVVNVENPDSTIMPQSALSFEQAIDNLHQTSPIEDKNFASISAIMGDIQEVNDNPF